MAYQCHSQVVSQWKDVKILTGMYSRQLKNFQHNQVEKWHFRISKRVAVMSPNQLLLLCLPFCSLTELMLMLAVVWLWLSGEGLLAVAVPGEARVGKVMSWMPCDRACCCFWRSLSSWAWAWAVSWLNRGYWASCCSSVRVSVVKAWEKTNTDSV